jgi:acyl-CoA dehydrogenase
MIIPKQYGGLGFSAQAHSAVVGKIASRSSSTAVTVMVPNSLGPAELLMHYGTEAQKNYYLPRLADGRELPCFGLTSPFAGSDASSIPDRGVVCHGDYKGQRVLGVSLTWEKRYITLAPVATVVGLAFQLYDPEHLVGDKDYVGITLALLPSTYPGVKIGRRHFPAKQAFQNGPISGTDVFIPMEMLIGGQERVGQGWRMLMQRLAVGRSVSLPALAAAATKFCARNTGAYARVRKQFKLPVGRFEGVEEVLARIAGEAYAVESARRVTAAALDQGHEPSVISALLKYQSTERQRSIVNDTMDVHGGRAICEGPSNYLANLYQAVPVSVTVEGANILTRTLITFGQGAIRCHPYLLKEIHAAQDKDTTRALAAFNAALSGHVAFILNNLARAFFYNLTGGKFMNVLPSSELSRWYSEVARTSVSFAAVADASLLLLGGELKRKEKLSGRFADILGEMYFMSAALKRFEDEGCLAEDQVLLEWACRNSLYKIQQSFDGILSNYPVRPLGWLLRAVIFPWGRHRRPPSDALGHRLADLLLQPSAQRDRLTDGVFVSRDPSDITGRLEYALDLVLKAEPIEKRVAAAIKSGQLKLMAGEAVAPEAIKRGVITAEEGALLDKALAATRAAIDVDDFAPEALTGEREQPVRAAAAVG